MKSDASELNFDKPRGQKVVRSVGPGILHLNSVSDPSFFTTHRILDATFFGEWIIAREESCLSSAFQTCQQYGRVSRRAELGHIQLCISLDVPTRRFSSSFASFSISFRFVLGLVFFKMSTLFRRLRCHELRVHVGP